MHADFIFETNLRREFQIVCIFRSLAVRLVDYLIDWHLNGGLVVAK